MANTGSVGGQVAVSEASISKMVKEVLQGKTLADMSKSKKIDVAQIVYHGEKLILPQGMSARGAIDLLEAHEQYLTTEVVIQEDYDVFPWDGANAVNEVLKAKFGWAQAIATPGFFGDKPPQLVRIAIGPNTYTEVPWGRFAIPGVKGWASTGVGMIRGRLCFKLYASVLRKDEQTIRELFSMVRDHLKEHSIYRGQAIKIRFNDDDGDALDMPEPEFLDTTKVKREHLIFPADVQSAIETNLFTPIERVRDVLANGMAVKRGVLLGGVYGTGKTLAATVASKIAVDNNITYVYVPRADELAKAVEFARQYQSPACVLFCEDVDRVLSGERDSDMDDILNIIDGIDSKSSNLIVVLTTNELNALEPAMLRPGRLDAVINVTEPDAEAVQKLLRVYGADAIAPDTDLTMAGVALAGRIPAVIAEVIQRAKLAQLRRQPAGSRVERLSEDAIIEAAQTMRAQLDLLDSKLAAGKPGKPALNQAMEDVMDAAIGRQIQRLASSMGVNLSDA